MKSGLNSNLMNLISKTLDALLLNQFRPIILGNFLFKILNKILAFHLASIEDKIVSKNQFGFIKGHHIQDCIDVASDYVNLMNFCCFGSNIAMKINIQNTFDTMQWPLLFQFSKLLVFLTVLLIG